MPSQNVKLPSLPPVQNVPWTLWKVMVLTAKTFCEPDCAGLPGIELVGMS
jgi:hypothetical protein